MCDIPAYFSMSPHINTYRGSLFRLGRRLTCATGAQRLATRIPAVQGNSPAVLLGMQKRFGICRKKKSQQKTEQGKRQGFKQKPRRREQRQVIPTIRGTSLYLRTDAYFFTCCVSIRILRGRRISGRRTSSLWIRNLLQSISIHMSPIWYAGSGAESRRYTCSC